MKNKDTNKRGLHILLDLQGCDLSKAPETTTQLADFMLSFLRRLADHRLTPTGNLQQLFGPHAFSLIVSLAESHISIHTWPEDKYVSADIFVCNYSRDNSDAAKQIAAFLIGEYSPKEIIRHDIER